MIGVSPQPKKSHKQLLSRNFSESRIVQYNLLLDVD
jgi:hypothetical protein